MATLRFLLLEDKLRDTEAIQTTLTEGGIDHELLRVETRADFVRALETTAFDLILSAYAMPALDGMAALEIASNLGSDLPFIFVSTSLGEELAIEALKRGATDYVLKQRLGRLVPCVQRALREAQERQERQRTKRMLVEQKQLLELIALGRSLDECLSAVCAAISQLNPHVHACFLLVDAQRQTFPRSITPDFPPSFGEGLKDAPINDLCIGTCGEALYYGQPVTCADIATDDRWSQGWRDLCIAHGILACHSMPVMGADGLSFGSLMLCLGETRTPTDWEHQLAEFGVQVASLVFERDRSSLALRQSEARYRTLFESIDEGFCVVEVLLDADDTPIDYRILEVNPIFEQQTGLQQAIGKTARQLNLEAHWIEIYGRVALTGESIRFENGSETLDRWFDVYACRTGEPEARRVAIVFKNISDRKRVEEIARRTAEVDAFRVALTDALRPLVDPVKVQATASRVLGEYLGANRVAYFEVRGVDYVVEQDYVNGAVALAGRYSIESFGPKLLAAYRTGRTVTVSDVQADPNLSPEQRSAYAAIEIAAYIGIPLVKQGAFVAGLAIHTAESRVWTPDEILLAEEVAERTWAAVERAHAEAVIAADLEDTQRLRELGARLITESDIQTLYQEILSTAIALTRADAGTVQILDDATQDLVLFAAQGFKRNMTEHFYRVNAKSNTVCGMALRNRDRIFVNFDVPECEDPNGSIRMHVEAGYLSAQSTPLITRSGKAIGMVSTHWREHHRPSDSQSDPCGKRESRFLDLLARQAADLIEQRQTAAEREHLLAREQAARAEADRANRIKDEFLAVLSHELRSPLNPILGWTRLLKSGKLDAVRQAEALQTIERNAKLQSQLIEDLLDISRIMQGKLSLTAAPVSWAFVISAAFETVRLAAEAKNIQIRLDLDPEIPAISGDAARLQQVVWNLLNNAVKFTPDGGQVTVELRQVDQVAQMRVIDTGKGIKPAFLPYVFEYFRQEDGSTTRQFGGLGLGLAIVRQIVEMHGGTVGVESQGEHQGTTFIVQLPVVQRATAIASEPASTSTETEVPLDNLQILLVDDDTDTREFQDFLLQQNGAQVIAVDSGLAALQALEQFTPDVIVSDIGMAAMDGYMLMQQIRSREANQSTTIPAIALTAYAAELDQQRALQVGFQVHITKPVEPEFLVQAILNLLQQT